MEDIEQKCLIRCIGAGQTIEVLKRDNIVFYPENVAGLVTKEDLTVPPSELAMHVRAAGKEILAWALGRTYAWIIFKDDKECCRLTSGLPTEVLSHRLIEVTNKILGR